MDRVSAELLRRIGLEVLDATDLACAVAEFELVSLTAKRCEFISVNRKMICVTKM